MNGRRGKASRNLPSTKLFCLGYAKDLWTENGRRTNIASKCLCSSCRQTPISSRPLPVLTINIDCGDAPSSWPKSNTLSFLRRFPAPEIVVNSTHLSGYDCPASVGDDSHECLGQVRQHTGVVEPCSPMESAAAFEEDLWIGCRGRGPSQLQRSSLSVSFCSMTECQ